MADSKITALTSIGASTDPANDPLVLVDVSDTSMAATGTTKKVTLNQLLGASGTATLASATITGDLTVDTSTLKVDSANNRVGVGTATPTNTLEVVAPAGDNIVSTFRSGDATAANNAGGGFRSISSATAANRVAQVWLDADGANFSGGDYFFIQKNGGSGTVEFNQSSNAAMVFLTNSTERMRIDSSGNLGIGVTPKSWLSSYKAIQLGYSTSLSSTTGTDFAGLSSNAYVDSVDSRWERIVSGYATQYYQNAGDGQHIWRIAGTAAADTAITWTNAMTLDASGNLGIGVTPEAWTAFNPVLRIKNASTGGGGALGGTGIDNFRMLTNTYYDGQYKRIGLGYATIYEQGSGAHVWYSNGSGSAGSTFTPTQAMTLDASGNLLVGITSGSYNRIKKDSVADAGNAIFELVGASNATSSIHYSVSSYNANAANAASKFGRDGVTLRSINAGGTVNASGADYAEYMTKAGGFVLSKGDVAGIDANGKLTNVFADAVSFVVKSTDPSYVGNDKWGNDLEGDELEAARQLVDRIAFAGQVPVNVIGAKSGDYIVPVVDGTGIKGIAVSNPTFEQYQLAVGKVIAIDSDGRARIIVKVA